MGSARLLDEAPKGAGVFVPDLPTGGGEFLGEQALAVCAACGDGKPGGELVDQALGQAAQGCAEALEFVEDCVGRELVAALELELQVEELVLPVQDGGLVLSPAAGGSCGLRWRCKGRCGRSRLRNEAGQGDGSTPALGVALGDVVAASSAGLPEGQAFGDADEGGAVVKMDEDESASLSCAGDGAASDPETPRKGCQGFSSFSFLTVQGLCRALCRVFHS